jgi:RNA polymerase sigma-70 factor (ECF subfamily)
MVYRFFANRAHAEAADLTQQTFTQATEAADSLQSSSSFRAYLVAIARNVLYSHLRRRWRGPRELESLATSLPAPNTSPSEGAARQQFRAIIGAALSRLPLDLQILLEIHFWEGLTLREVADVFSIPEGTAKSRLNRALRILRGHVDEILVQPRVPTASHDVDFDAWSAKLRRLLAHVDTLA